MRRDRPVADRLAESPGDELAKLEFPTGLDIFWSLRLENVQ
jgi:hypothetical protein